MYSTILSTLILSLSTWVLASTNSIDAYCVQGRIGDVNLIHGSVGKRIPCSISYDQRSDVEPKVIDTKEV